MHKSKSVLKSPLDLPAYLPGEIKTGGCLRSEVSEHPLSWKETWEGACLGLSLSYEILTKGHGGKLTFETLEGTGSAFIIALPVQ